MEKITQFLLSLKKVKGVGNKTICKILETNHELIVNQNTFNLSFLEKLNHTIINKNLLLLETEWDLLQKDSLKIIELSKQKGIEILNPFMETYPKRLLFNSHYPPIFFAKGNISLLNSNKAISIIGTRNPTEYGVKFARRIAYTLAEKDYVIVSGLAIGSDTAGHLGALDINGKTIAVLPVALDDSIYPKENQQLAEKILSQNGLLVSEYATGVKLQGKQLVMNLIARDEWQPGLSDGVLIIESSTTGGTNHAARHAIKTGTPLAALDYSSLKGKEFYDNPRFGANCAYIKEGKANAIFYKESLINFMDKMSDYYQSNINKLIQEKKDDKEIVIENITLF